ncbi:MAG: tetratricopeptide repeat protein [Candidatus Handelsmanbacteria bacterium]|nr:tetratricopeptide repeat protein [Candidatus Handelsmanbacteria bacterium]
MTQTDSKALYKSGMGKFVRQDFAGAVEDFNQALALDPEFGDVYQALAHAYEKLGDLDAALAAGQRAAQCNPDDFLVHTSLSILYQRKGLIPQAESEKAIAAQLQHRR